MKRMYLGALWLGMSLISFAGAPEIPEPILQEAATGDVARVRPSKASLTDMRTISSEHVNLVRVDGEAIVDVVYDAEALEIEPDKSHGTVFLRVKPTWKATGKRETAVYFNTPEESYGLMLRSEDVPSQTLVIASRVPPSLPDASPHAPDASRMGKLTATSYVSQLKECLLRAVREEAFPTHPVATTFSRKERTVEALDFKRREKSCNGFLLSQSHAYATRDYAVDVISVRNLMLGARPVPIGRFARETEGILALAREESRLKPGAVTDLIFISRRDLREKDGQITLAIDSICRKKDHVGAP